MGSVEKGSACCTDVRTPVEQCVEQRVQRDVQRHNRPVKAPRMCIVSARRECACTLAYPCLLQCSKHLFPNILRIYKVVHTIGPVMDCLHALHSWCSLGPTHWAPDQNRAIQERFPSNAVASSSPTYQSGVGLCLRSPSSRNRGFRLPPVQFSATVSNSTARLTMSLAACWARKVEDS